MEEEIDRLNETIDDLISEISELKSELQDEQKLVLETERYVSDLQDEVNNSEEQIRDLEATLKDAEIKINSLEEYAAESIYRDCFKIKNITLDDISRLQLLGELNTKYPTTLALSNFIKTKDVVCESPEKELLIIEDLECNIQDLERDKMRLNYEIDDLSVENYDLQDKVYELTKYIAPNSNKVTLDDVGRLELLYFIGNKYPTTLLLSEFLGEDLVNEARGIVVKHTGNNICSFNGCKCTKVIGNTKEEIRNCAGSYAANEWVGCDTAGNDYHVVTCLRCNKKSTFLGE